MRDSATLPALSSGPAGFSARVRALDALLAAARNHPLLAGAEVRDTSNRSTRDWPWWSVDISDTRTNGPECQRLTARIQQNSTPQGDIGPLEGKWRAEEWIGVAANRRDVSGDTSLAYEQLDKPEAFVETIMRLLDQARSAR